MTFDNPRRALITGASSGIGKATALAFAQAGYDLALVSRSQTALEAVAEAARQHQGTAKVYPLDLAAVDQVKPKLTAVLEDFGPVEVLVNNAGMGYTRPLGDTPLADWQQVIALNLTSVLQCIQAVLPKMRDRKSGTIINVGSIAASNAFPEWGAYSVSKAGLISLSNVLAAEERGNGIRVVTLHPGSVNTAIWDSETVTADLDRSQMLTPDLVAETILYAAQMPSHGVLDTLTLMPAGGAL